MRISMDRKNSENKRFHFKRHLVVLIAGVFFMFGCGKDSTPDALTPPQVTTVPTPSPEPFVEHFLEEATQGSARITAFGSYGVWLQFSGALRLPPVKKAEGIYLQLAAEENNDVAWEVELPIVEEKNGSAVFELSERINEGLVIDTMPSGKYRGRICVRTTDGEEAYYLFTGNPEMDDLSYYTVTQEGKNECVSMAFVSAGDEGEYFAFSKEEAPLPEDVYDVVIDAGHGGKDCGALSDFLEYSEADLTLQYALCLKECFESLGLKVLITRDGTEDPEINTAYTTYDEDGRVNKTIGSGAKLCLSIHFNSSVGRSAGGLEIFCSNRGNSILAERFANDLVADAGSYFSNRQIGRVAGGVFNRVNSARELAESEQKAYRMGYEPYNITEDTDYYYMIREIGAHWTNAYIDGRNTEMGVNLYRDSNCGVESMILEMAYINVYGNIMQFLGEEDRYLAAMTNTMQWWLDSLKLPGGTAQMEPDERVIDGSIPAEAYMLPQEEETEEQPESDAANSPAEENPMPIEATDGDGYPQMTTDENGVPLIGNPDVALTAPGAEEAVTPVRPVNPE